MSTVNDPRPRIEVIRQRLRAGALGGIGPELRWLADEADRLADEVDRVNGELGELTQAQYHDAYVMCGHGIRTVTMEAFGRKISEKRDAIGQRAEAVAEAERAREAEQVALRRIAELESVITWDTTCGGCAKLLDSSYAETVRAETAEATLLRVQAVSVPVRDARMAEDYYDGWGDALAAVRDALAPIADEEATR